MPIRKAHGAAAQGGSLVVVESTPSDELPDGTPAPARPAANRDAAGRFQRGPGTQAQAKAAALAKAEQDRDARKFGRLLGLATLPADHPYSDYVRLAHEIRDDSALDLAATTGGGRLSPAVNSIVASAALATAASRFLYDQGAETGNVKLLGQAARLADQARMSLLTATDLAAREAAARAERENDNSPPSWFVRDVPPTNATASTPKNENASDGESEPGETK